jgi:hypothetical protein
MPLVNATGYWDVADYGSTPLYTAALSGEEIAAISKEEKSLLRSLAERVMQLSLRPETNEIRDLWYRHNRFEPTRPLIICDPENGWNEIISGDQLQCSSRLAKHWEMVLRKEIFWGEHICDDRPIEPVFRVGYSYRDSGFGVEEQFLHRGSGGSYTWIPAVRKHADIERLKEPRLEIDHETTERAFDLAKEILGDVLHVEKRGVWWWSLGLTYDLVVLRGMEQVMVDMIDEPSFVHELMHFLMESALSKLEFLEAERLLSLNASYYLQPGGFGYTDELPAKDFQGSVRTVDMWGFAESQETVGISPDMFAELIFPYQVRVLNRFGLNSYGCCEPLQRRWETVKQIPRLRKVSVSSFADIEKMAAQLGDSYCYCMKPHPADLAVPHLDKEKVRQRLRRAFELTKECRVEVLMQDNHTIGNNPQNVIDWVRIAREEADRIVA